jgi:uncharacterized protein (DUF885 family)
MMTGMTTVPSIPALAEQLARRLLDANPLQGTALGLREYDGLLPEESAAADAQLVADISAVADTAARTEAADSAERITQAAIASVAERTRLGVEVDAATYTVTAMPMAGPPALFAVAARTVLPDAQAADDYLSRLRAAPRWIDQTGERLQEGRAGGRLPIRSLVQAALRWADRALAAPVPAALTAPTAPPGWDGTSAWTDERERLIRDEIVPAIGRWRDVLVQLEPESRADDAAGLVALPDGPELYRRCIAVHTTLPLTAQELHETGLDSIRRLEQRATELGASIGLAEVVRAVRASGEEADAEASLLAAREAVARAEARAAQIMPPPLPAPCAVEPMPPTVAESGMAPHYTRPRADTGRPGTFWFNTARATAGSGWDLEAVAFHETVPGHHSQLARLQLIEELPLLQQFSVTVHAEGWGLYAERLADEFGLYSDTRAELGSVYIEMHRAARLVVDTGLHALGWSRDQAVQFMTEHVALPRQFLADEIDRYLAWPGQALAYLTGQREILRLRAEAEAELGDRFDLRAFHSAVLDQGSLPMPVLATAISEWVAARR